MSPSHPCPARVALRTLAAVALCLPLTGPAGVARAQELTPQQKLGKRLFFDTSLSTPPGQSCGSCHAPKAGFTSPDEEVNAAGAVLPGATGDLFGPRKTPSVAYASFSKPLAFKPVPQVFTGGQFWDGRVDTLVQQAKRPLLSPLEMNNRDARAVVRKVAKAPYAALFTQVYGPGSLDPASPDAGFHRVALALAAYQSSAEVNPFSSKYDAFLAGEAQLDDSETRGLALFEGNRSKCTNCHGKPVGAPIGTPNVFTRFGYHNLGVPKNPENPFYEMPFNVNPAGMDFVDLGLGEWFQNPNFPSQAGKVKTPTLRNVDRRPRKGFVKAFMHNGAFKSLEEVVHFYNVRDVPGVFPPAEVPGVTVEPGQVVGNLGLSDAEEADLVAFLRTLTDGEWERRP